MFHVVFHLSYWLVQVLASESRNFMNCMECVFASRWEPITQHVPPRNVSTFLKNSANQYNRTSTHWPIWLPFQVGWNEEMWVNLHFFTKLHYEHLREFPIPNYLLYKLFGRVMSLFKNHQEPKLPKWAPLTTTTWSTFDKLPLTHPASQTTISKWCKLWWSMCFPSKSNCPISANCSMLLGSISVAQFPPQKNEWIECTCVRSC